MQIIFVPPSCLLERDAQKNFDLKKCTSYSGIRMENKGFKNGPYVTAMWRLVTAKQCACLVCFFLLVFILFP